MKRLLCLPCLVLALFVPNAHAVDVTGDPQFQAWADQSLVSTPSFRIFARNRSCPFSTAAPGRVVACARRFTVWVELGFGDGSRWRFFHELGHVVHRQVFGGRFWLPEVFAERFAQCGIYGEQGVQVFPVPLGWCARLSGWIDRRGM